VPDAGVEFRVVPDLYELSFDHVDVGDLGGIPLIGLKEISLKGWNLVVKRTMDLTLTLLAAPLLLLLAGLIALAIRRDSPGPAIFRQRRIGKDGSRSWPTSFARWSPTLKSARPTWSRSTRPMARSSRFATTRARLAWAGCCGVADELPQSSLRDMSLVGPRPPMPDESLAMPSIPPPAGLLLLTTGLWRCWPSDTSRRDGAADIYYAENWSPAWIRILLQTIRCAIGAPTDP
jgi:lipopolysaccharide/colanic/teichoic acid biosynthesis glycosyltransferase